MENLTQYSNVRTQLENPLRSKNYNEVSEKVCDVHFKGANDGFPILSPSNAKTIKAT